MRADDPGQFAVVAASFRPLLSYVRDWCDARPTDETDVVVLAQTHGNFLDRALTDHLLGRRDIAFLVEVDRAFWAALGESLPTLTLKLVFCLRERVRLMQSMGVADDIVQALGGAHLLGDEEDEKRRVAHLLELEERPNIVDDAPAAPRASSVGGWFARLFGRTNKSVNREDLP